MAIFDLLTRPEPELTKAQKVDVKAIARKLLAKLKREKLILDWRLKENAKADVPEVYDRRIWEDKVERTFQFVFEQYAGGRQPAISMISTVGVWQTGAIPRHMGANAWTRSPAAALA